MSALPPKADMFSVDSDVCFVPKADVSTSKTNLSFVPQADIACCRLRSSGSMRPSPSRGDDRPKQPTQAGVVLEFRKAYDLAEVRSNAALMRFIARQR